MAPKPRAQPPPIPKKRPESKATRTTHSASSNSVGDIVQRVAKKRRGDVCCSRCGNSPSDKVEWARHDPAGEPEGGACARCWRVFCKGWAHKYEWYQYCEVLEDDENERKLFDAACKISAGEAERDFFPSEVAASSTSRLEIRRSLVGIPRSEFLDLTGRSPEDLKLQQVDMRDENGVTFRGILCRNPWRPWVEIDVVNEKALTNTELKMPRDYQVKPTQGAEQWEHLVKARIDEDKLAHKAKTCTMTVQQLGAKCGIDIMAAASAAYGWGNAAPPTSVAAAATAAATGGRFAMRHSGAPQAATIGASQGSEDDCGAEKSRAPLQVNKADGPCIIRAATAEGKRKRSPSPAASRVTGAAPSFAHVSLPGGFRTLGARTVAASRMSGRSPAGRTTRGSTSVGQLSPASSLEATAEFHISQVSIEALLAGKPQGHGIRWARDWLEKQSAGNQEDPCLTVLSDHLDDAKVAERLGKTHPTKYASPSALMKDLNALGDYGASFPTVLKYDILHWYLDQNLAVDKFDKYLLACCPWKTKSDKADEEWKPFLPELYLMEGTKQELSKLFRTKALTALVIFIRQGDDMVKDTQRAVDMLLEFINTHQPVDESGGSNDEMMEAEDENGVFDEDITALVQVGKALKLLFAFGTAKLEVDHFDSVQDLVEFPKAKFQKIKTGPDSSLAMVAKVIHEDKGYYQRQLKLFTEYILPAKKHWPLLKASVEAMKGVELKLSECRLPVDFADGLRVLAPAMQELPQGSCHEFRRDMMGEVEKVADAAVQLLNAGGPVGEPDLAMEFQKGMSSLMNQAIEVLPAMKDKWDSVLSALRAATDKSLQTTLAGRLEEVLKTIKIDDGDNEVLDSSLNEPLINIIGQVKRGFELPSPVLDHLAPLALAAAQACIVSCRDREGYSLWHDAAIDLVGLCDNPGDAAAVKRDAKLVERALQVKDAMAKFDNLGRTLEERIEARNVEDVLQEWGSLAKAAGEGVPENGDQPAVYTEEVKSSLTAWNEVKDAMVNMRRDVLVEAEAAVAKHLEACAWPMPANKAAAPWDDFMAAAASFLDYSEAVAMCVAMEALVQAHDGFDRVCELFEVMPDVDFREKTSETRVCSDAMVWTVKTLKKITEMDPEQKVKAARFSKKQLSAIKPSGKDHKLVKFVPAALVWRLESSASI